MPFTPAVSDPSPTPPAARIIGYWLAGLERSAIPDHVASVARACIIDTLGVALAGIDSDTARLARAEAMEVHAAGSSTLLGGGCLCAEGAAFANTATAHALDFDDNSYAGFVHGSAVVVPTALAVVEAVGGSGADLLTAVVAGAEAQYALAVAVTNEVYQAGWWTTALFGAVGAAAAASKGYGLRGDQAADAIAFALCGTGGLRACFGTGAKPLLAAQSAANGLRAARLAARGLTVPHGVVEDPRGFTRLIAQGHYDPTALKALGHRWHLLDPGIDTKAYPVCLSSHAAADGVRDLMARHGLTAEAVAAVRCRVPPVVAANLTYDHPATVGEARFSLPFAVACVMLYGDLTLDRLSAAALADPALRIAMARVTMTPDADWDTDAERARVAPEGAEVAVETTDGRLFTLFCASARGTVARPLSEAEHTSKFLACAARSVGPNSARELHQRLLNIDTFRKADELLDGMCRV
ncbi:MmgE/PrpD family protein [Azospirillum doebereinerae]